MRICVSSYSFSQLMRKGEVTQFDTIRLAKELGFDGIEFVELTPPDGTSLLDYAVQLAAEAAKQGIAIANYCIGANFAQTGEAFQAEINRVKGQVDVAAALGVFTMRHDALAGLGTFRSFSEALPSLAEGCRIITEYAAQKGIRTMVENHGFICQDPDRVEALHKAVSHSNFGLLADMGNFLCADCDPIYAVGKIRESVIFAHAKDFIVKSGSEPDPGEGFFKSRGGNYLRGTIIGHGRVPVKQCIQILRSAGYDGWLSVEFEGIEENIMALRIGLDNLRRFVVE